MDVDLQELRSSAAMYMIVLQIWCAVLSMVTTSTHLAVHVQCNAKCKWLHAVIHRARADGNLVSSEHAWQKGIMKAVQLYSCWHFRGSCYDTIMFYTRLIGKDHHALPATLSCWYVLHKANW